MKRIIRSLTRRFAFARRVLNKATGRFSLKSTISKEVDPTPMSSKQLDLFGLIGPIITYKPRAKFRKKLTRNGGKVQLQYVLTLRVRKNERKLAFRSKAAPEIGENDFQWSDQGKEKLHYILLRESLAAIKELMEIGSTKVLEILTWINRNRPDEPFSFETCLAYASQMDDEFHGVDAEFLRIGINRGIKARFGAELPHVGLLQRAIRDSDRGDSSAIDWINEDSQGELSFFAACNALGFDHKKAREQLQLHHHAQVHALCA